MAPKEMTETFIAPSGVLFENEFETVDGGLIKPGEQFAKSTKHIIVWSNVYKMLLFHLLFFGGFFVLLTGRPKWQTVLTVPLFFVISGLGITAGVHRLWCHRSYKATKTLRVILMIFNTMAFQGSVIQWTRDHRVHHKFSDTDADPHNSLRGFFFSHLGWLLVKKHPNVIAAGKKIDLSDLEADPILVFQRKHYLNLGYLICFIIPTLIPVFGWNETWLNAFLVNAFRYVLLLHVTWSLNSFAHMYGNKPYDQHMTPTQNIYVAAAALGEGWHNYHHAFPWDYKASEFGQYGHNLTTGFIDFTAKIGLAYDLKKADHNMIDTRMARTGDGTKNNRN